MLKVEMEEGLERRTLGDTRRALIIVKQHKTGRLCASSEAKGCHLALLSQVTEGVCSTGGRLHRCQDATPLAEGAPPRLPPV